MIICIFHVDIDECETSNGQCTQTCVNSVGSFKCTCKPGYVLSEDLKTCKGKRANNFLIVKITFLFVFDLGGKFSKPEN